MTEPKLPPCAYRGRILQGRGKCFCSHSKMPQVIQSALCETCTHRDHVATQVKRQRCQHQLDVIEVMECRLCGGKKVELPILGCALHERCVKNVRIFEKVRENEAKAYGKEYRNRPLKSCESCKDHTSPMPHTIDDITLAILCFKRPEKVVEQIRSIREFYNLPIIVGDNGNDPPDVSEFHGVSVHALEYDCGISAARNRLTELVSTDLIMQLDDDFVWTEDTNLQHLVDVLNADRELTGVAGWMHDIEDETREPLKVGWCNQIAKIGTNIDVRPIHGPTRVTPTGVPWQYAESILNCALYRTDKIKELGWREELKVNEHLEFSYRAKQQGHRLAFCPWVSVIHDRFPRSEEYNAHRHRPLELASMQAVGARTKTVRQWAKTGHQPQRNLLLLTPGHTGSTIVSRMLSAIGWDIGNADEYAEDVDVRAINQRFLSTGEFDRREARKIVGALRNPFCIKDPRFAEPGVLQHWMPVFEKHEPSLIYLTRNTDRIVASYQSREESVVMAHRRIKECKRIAEHWPWGSVTVDFDAVREAVSLFDESMIASPVP